MIDKFTPRVFLTLAEAQAHRVLLTEGFPEVHIHDDRRYNWLGTLPDGKIVTCKLTEDEWHFASVLPAPSTEPTSELSTLGRADRIALLRALNTLHDSVSEPTDGFGHIALCATALLNQEARDVLKAKTAYLAAIAAARNAVAGMV